MDAAETGKSALEAKLVALLARIDFARRYYAFCDQHADRTPDRSLKRADCERLLKTTGLAFKYESRERFFSYREPGSTLDLVLNVALAHGLELILTFRTPTGTLGGPFHVLAAEVAQLSEPGVAHDPPYPRLPYHDLEDLREALALGLDLYQEARAQIVAERWDVRSEPPPPSR